MLLCSENYPPKKVHTLRLALAHQVNSNSTDALQLVLCRQKVQCEKGGGQNTEMQLLKIV
jgi:hypothetical protein